MLIPVIVAGGWGTRFWPLSTPDRPKQFVPLGDGRSMLRRTYERLIGLVPPEQILVLTSAAHAQAAAAAVPELPRGNIVGEPIPRDSAAAAALAVSVCRRRFPGAVMAFLPSDATIEPAEAFRGALAAAAQGARESGSFYTFGVTPTRAATEYGYLECAAPVSGPGEYEHRQLASFEEKPNEIRAEELLQAGNFLWNSGIFVWTLDTVAAAMDKHMPVFLKTLDAVPLDEHGSPEPAALEAALLALPKTSIDYALLEKHDDLRCLVAPFAWSDVAGWASLAGETPADSSGAPTRGQVARIDSDDCFIWCEDKAEEVGLLGVKDLVVVRVGKRTLVAHRDRLEDLKQLVKQELYPELHQS